MKRILQHALSRYVFNHSLFVIYVDCITKKALNIAITVGRNYNVANNAVYGNLIHRAGSLSTEIRRTHGERGHMLGSY